MPLDPKLAKELRCRKMILAQLYKILRLTMVESDKLENHGMNILHSINVKNS